MTGIGSTKQRDERSRQLARIGWLTHVACVVPMLVGGVVCYLAFYAPVTAQERQQYERISEVEGLLGKANNVRAELHEAEQKLKRQQKRAAEVRERIPDQPREMEFLRSLSQAALDSGVENLNFRLGASSRGRTYSQIDVHLDCEASYDSLCRFLDRLEQIPRVARVMSLEVTADPAQSQYPVKLDIRLYYGVHRTMVPGGNTVAGPRSRSGSPRGVRIGERRQMAGQGGRHG